RRTARQIVQAAFQLRSVGSDREAAVLTRTDLIDDIAECLAYFKRRFCRRLEGPSGGRRPQDASMRSSAALDRENDVLSSIVPCWSLHHDGDGTKGNDASDPLSPSTRQIPR